MAWYTTGTVTVTNGSDTVDGVGSTFLNLVKAGHIFYGPDKELYEVSAVVSDSQIRLASVYNGTTDIGTSSWAVIPTQGLSSDLLDGVQDLIGEYAEVKDALATGAFASGTTGSPGITFAGDPTTGINLSTAGFLALIASGVANVTITSNGVSLGSNGATIVDVNGAGITVNGTIDGYNLADLDARITALETP